MVILNRPSLFMVWCINNNSNNFTKHGWDRRISNSTNLSGDRLFLQDQVKELLCWVPWIRLIKRHYRYWVLVHYRIARETRLGAWKLPKMRTLYQNTPKVEINVKRFRSTFFTIWLFIKLAKVRLFSNTKMDSTCSGLYRLIRSLSFLFSHCSRNYLFQIASPFCFSSWVILVGSNNPVGVSIVLAYR